MSKDLRFYVLENDYNVFAGANWPAYNEYVSGVKSSVAEVQKEIDEFTKKQIKLGIKGKFLLNAEHNTKYIPEHDNDLEYKRKSFDLPSIKTDIINTCNVPWNIISIDNKGRIFVCECEGHVPFPVGHVMDFENFEDIFNSPEAQKIQQAVKNKTFEYCAVDFCGVRGSSLIYPTNQIKVNIEIDISCNIQCPSCRERKIFVNDPKIIRSKLDLGDRVAQWIKKTNKTVIIGFAGGEPLASLVYSKLFDQYIQFSNVQFILRSNGLLIKKNIDLIKKLQSRLTLSISIDAASKNTYEQKTRVGGRWEHLIEGLTIIKNLGIPSQGNFVIQKKNLHEVISFVNLCRLYNLEPSFTILQDWGTWHDYREQCVHFPDSVLYNEFKQVIAKLVSMNVNIPNMENWVKQ
jgi:MoaA/NifB/PqqE/SkfB family radical SAM enzyme